jgi:hypothetical protein
VTSLLRPLALVAALSFGIGCSSFAPRALMSDGQRMYFSKCTSCHSAYEPHEYTPQQWKEAIAEMEADKRIQLTTGDRALILSYLTGETGLTAPAAPPATAPAGSSP